MGEGDLAMEVISNGLSMPAVLVGNAAHSIPEFLSPADISWVIMDAMDLCYMIVERYYDDRLFSQILKDFYDIKYHRWQKSLHEWDEKWTSAHGLPYNSTKARSTWIKLARPSRRLEGEFMSESISKSLPAGDRQAIQTYKYNELARWGVIQQRISDRLERKYAFKTPPGVEPTKLVLRYIDSRLVPEETGEQQSIQDRDSRGTKSSCSS